MKKAQTQSLTPKNIVPFLKEIFERHGGREYLGEPVTMAEHMLQAATLAEQTGKQEPVIAAALLHDIGHFTGELGGFSMSDTHDRFHEEAGARLLQPFLPPVVIACIRRHVAAKRYLCATDPDYLSRLSAASVHSLNLQGGPMRPAEVAEFENERYLNQILQVRRLDDAGKQAGVQTPPFAHFAPLVQRLIDRHCGRQS